VSQLTLFPDQAPPLFVRKETGKWDRETPYAFLYTATEKGNHSGIKFMMTIEDAMDWCSSKVSCGNIHGTNWAYFWTSVTTFILDFQDGNSSIDLSGENDDGMWDERIEALGLKKISLWDIPSALAPFGISVTGAPSKILNEISAKRHYSRITA
jgi:hypothetical protein